MSSAAAKRLADEICAQLDPVMEQMVEGLGVEVTVCILQGLCRRLEQRARDAGLWNAELYAQAVKIDQFAEQLAGVGE